MEMRTNIFPPQKSEYFAFPPANLESTKSVKLILLLGYAVNSRAYRMWWLASNPR